MHRVIESAYPISFRKNDARVLGTHIAHHNNVVIIGMKRVGISNFLQSRLGELCERFDIVNAVWPQEAELGVSDWAVDRLVARVRVKLKLQKSPYHIETVITRGYKLISAT